MEEIRRDEAVQEVADIQNEPYKSGSMQYIDSREVAEMVEKQHKNLLADINKYAKELTKLNFQLSDFFIESTYSVDGQSRTYPCYLVTRKGCEFIAHKLTGEKGTKFTATYINRFHDMEDSLNAQLVPILQQFMEQQMEKLGTVIERLEKLEERRARCLENPYSDVKDGSIENRKKEIYELTSKVAELCGNKHTKILHYMYRTLEEELGITLDSYKSVYRSKTGKQDASMVEVIAANEEIYNAAVEMNRSVIERKQIYGQSSH